MRRVTGDEVIGDRGQLVDVGRRTGLAAAAPLFGCLVVGWALTRFVVAGGESGIAEHEPVRIGRDDRGRGQIPVSRAGVMKAGQHVTEPG
jgi:hypothetical protein